MSGPKEDAKGEGEGDRWGGESGGVRGREGVGEREGVRGRGDSVMEGGRRMAWLIEWVSVRGRGGIIRERVNRHELGYS